MQEIVVVIEEQGMQVCRVIYGPLEELLQAVSIKETKFRTAGHTSGMIGEDS